MEPKGSVPCSQEPNPGSNPDQVEFSQFFKTPI